MPRLRRADCSIPGIVRRRRGRGFEYIDQSSNEKIDDPEMLERIRELVIPPAWGEVWICPDPYGHIQAVGTDAAGRKQYMYHRRWRERRDAQKFNDMLDFARRLPALRKICAADLRADGMPIERACACATRLFDLGFFRIGTESYAEINQTYGVATMHKRHVRIKGDELVFDFPAKNSQRRIQSIVDSEVREVIKVLKKRRGGGPELLAYKNGGQWHDLRSSDINEYIKEGTGGDFSAKDFRTWHATVLASVALAVSGGAAGSRTARKRAVSRAVKEVAHYLGNTPAVARASYIDPRVFDRYRGGWTISGALDDLGEEGVFGRPSTQGAIEAAVIDLLEDDRSSDAVERIDPDLSLLTA
jgi:DNA topoisomerase I